MRWFFNANTFTAWLILAALVMGINLLGYSTGWWTIEVAWYAGVAYILTRGIVVYGPLIKEWLVRSMGRLPKN